MSMGTIIALFALIVISLAFICYAVYVKWRRRYTRERYAFTALGATVTLVVLALASFSIAPPWTIISALLAHLFNNPALTLPEPHWSERILAFGLVAFAIWLLYKMFAEWNGPVSDRQHQLLKLQDPSSLFREGTAETLRIIRRESPSPVYVPPEAAALQLYLEAPAGTRAWRDDARELVELKWQQYIFISEDNWHERQSCWVGSDVKTNNSVALMCCQESPSQEELSEFVSYVCGLSSVSTGKIEFIVAARTGNSQTIPIEEHTIKIECENSLLEGLVDFTDYFVDMKRRVEKESLPDSELAIPDVYVPSNVIDANDNEVTGSLEDYLLSWLAEEGQRHLAVLGEYGQGKSTGTLMFAHRLLTEDNATALPVPLFIELRGKSPSTLQPIELLGAWASAYRIDPRALIKLLVKGRVFLIFDGFDEMAGVADSEARLNHFRALWKFAYPDAKLLFTGRPNFFLDDAELKAALGVGSSPGNGPYCEHISLKPFGSDQIRNSLRWASSSVRDEILDLSKKDERFRDIVSRPSLLYIVGRLWGSPDFAQITETADAAQVMGAFVQHCYRRQTEKQREFPQFMVLTERERAYFMDGVAAFMAAGRMPNQITRTQLEKAVVALYAKIPEDILPEPSLPEPFSGPLKTRMANRDDAIEAILTDVRTCGLLVRDYSRPSALKFPHKSFFEYLLGSIAADILLGERSEYCAAIRSATEFDPVNVINVPESLSFLGEIIARSMFSGEHPETTINTLLDAIVMPRAIRIPQILHKTYLRLLVYTRMSNLRWLYPSLTMLFMLISSMMFVVSYMGDSISFLQFNSNAYSIAFKSISIVLIGVTTLLYPTTMMGPLKFRNIALWYAVVISLGISDEVMAHVFGKKTMMAIKRTASIYF